MKFWFDCIKVRKVEINRAELRHSLLLVDQNQVKIMKNTWKMVKFYESRECRLLFSKPCEFITKFCKIVLENR